MGGRARQQLAEGRDVYTFFKHESATGALYAEELLKAAA